MRVRLPSPDELKHNDKELVIYLSKLVQALERALEKLPETPFMKDQIKVLNLTELYSFDVSTATLGELRQIVGTLISRLRETGVFP